LPSGQRARFFQTPRDDFTEEYVGLTGTGNVNYVMQWKLHKEIIKTFTEDERLIGFFLPLPNQNCFVRKSTLSNNFFGSSQQPSNANTECRSS
jgi:hypothetical protein